MNIKSKKILSIKVTANEHIHDDSKVLPKLGEGIIKSKDVKIYKVLVNGGPYYNNAVLEFYQIQGLYLALN